MQLVLRTQRGRNAPELQRLWAARRPFAARRMLLATLTCQGTRVSDLSPLEHCTHLTFLSLSGCKITAASVAALQKALPNCKIEWDDPTKPKTPGPTASGAK